jgi:outer membrane immunogenic protein
MKKLLVAGIAVSAFYGAAALAADMPAKAPVYKASPAAIYDWTGFYVGGNAGYGVGRDPGSEADVGAANADKVTLAPHGWLGGVQAGYNWQAQNWVLGIEGDWQWTGQKDSFCFNDPNCGAAGERGGVHELPWFATARGRIGYATGPTLFYATGGVVFAQVKQTIFDGALATTFDNSKTGWTVGGGIEAALGGNWTAKIEYLFIDLGNVSNSDGAFAASSAVRDHVARLGLNYRFGGTGSGVGTPVVAAYNWTGSYAGANVGYGVSRDSTHQLLGGLEDALVITPGGAIAGGQLGYNWQSGHTVVGVEADAQWSGQKDQLCRLCPPLPGFTTQFISNEMPWFATARTRLGYASGSTLFYATGGAAFANIKLNASNTITVIGTNSASVSSDRAGWTVGGGIEAALAGNWTAKIEYLYMDLGSVSASVGPLITSSLTSEIRDHVVRVGLNYKFGDPGWGNPRSP